MKVVAEVIQEIIKHIPILNDCQEIIKIDKGFSSDDKYIIIQNDHSKLLLRVFNANEYEEKKLEYEVMQRMEEFEVLCSKPIQIGKLSNKGYMITSFLEGIDAQDELPNYADEDHYIIGFQAGQELRKMHLFEAPNHISSWYSRKLEKHKKYIDAYLECQVRIKNDEQIMKFIDENVHLMKKRPNLFQHDDVHPGNIIVKNKRLAGIIDFNRFDWGDPIHEFLKIGLFSREISVPFSIGQIKGYFDGAEPGEDFWRLYSLYLAMCVFSTVVWTIRTIPDNLDEMMDKIYTFLDDHEYFQRLKPTWYE